MKYQDIILGYQNTSSSLEWKSDDILESGADFPILVFRFETGSSYLKD